MMYRPVGDKQEYIHAPRTWFPGARGDTQRAPETPPVVCVFAFAAQCLYLAMFYAGQGLSTDHPVWFTAVKL